MRVKIGDGVCDEIVNLGRNRSTDNEPLIADDVPHKEVKIVSTLTVRMTGIVSLKPWREPPLMVNDIDIIRAVDEELRNCGVKPVRDNSDCFAGQVMVTVRLMGDLEEGKEDDKK